MRKHVLIGVVLSLIILGVSFLNVLQQQEAHVLRKTVSTVKEELVILEEKNKELLSKNEYLSNQTQDAKASLKKARKKYTDSGANIDLNSEYINIVTKLFEANLNFTPKNYEDKKKEVSQYLSEEMKEEYFGQKRKSYQDANGTTSQLELLEIYLKELQENDLTGLVVVNYRSKQNGREWTKDMNVFQVIYDCQSKKVKKISNLGNSFSNFDFIEK